MTFFKLLAALAAAMLLAAAPLSAQRRIDLRHNGASTLFIDNPAAATAAVGGFRL